jgi:hypothetical protein
MASAQLLQYVIPLVVVVIVLTLRFRRMGKERPLELKRFWLVPSILGFLAIVTIAGHPPSGIGMLVCLAALLLGAAVGWHRGKLMRISCDPATGKLTQSASPAAMFLLVGIIAIRFATRALFQSNGTPGRIDEQTLLLTDALLMFAVGLISLTRIEMAIRARRILAEREMPAE